jgi:hypothetical protein
MRDLVHSLAIACLVLCGAMTAGLALPAWWAAGSGSENLMAHRQFMLTLLGVALVVAASVPSWRGPTLATAIAAKAAFLLFWSSGSPSPTLALESAVLLLLVGAGAVLAREALQEARWQGVVLPLHAKRWQ